MQAARILSAAIVAAIPWSAPASPASPTERTDCPKFKKDESPKAVLKTSTERVKEIIRRKAETQAAMDKRDVDLKNEVNAFIDFDELGIRALGSHWDGLDEQKRKKFLSTLRDLIETAYTTRIKQHLNFTVEYTKAEVDCDKAFVATVAKAKRGKLKTDYRLHWKNGRWYVWDLIIEDTSLVRQYKTMFNKIIKRNGFDSLLNRMLNKKEEILKAKKLKKENAGAKQP